MSIDLPLVWAGVIAFGVFMYVLMDGFDLGVGIIFPFARSEGHRDVMMNSVAPIWDGNETWLVLGGGGLLAAFPVAYATILPALYLPVLLMLIALVFRGVAFEFRFETERHRPAWSWSFHLGSLLAAFSQGLILGAFITGFEVEGRDFVGGTFDWLTPFNIAVGFGMIAGYTLLGSTWIIMKTEGALQAWAYGIARKALFVVLAFIALVSIWTPLVHPDIAERWFTLPNIFYLSPVPIMTGVTGLALYIVLQRRREVLPFLLSLGIFTLSYIGLAISLWPHVVPPDITIWEAAAVPKSQLFLLVGVAIVVPIILIYTAYSYYVFRGKVREDEGYH